MHVFVRGRSAAEEFNPRPVLPCTDVLLPQRKTWWWGWLNKLWAVSTSQVTICGPLRRLMLYRGFTARRSTCHGGSQRARGRVKLSHFYLVPLCKTFSPTYVCLKVCLFSFHTEITRFPKRTSQVTVWSQLFTTVLARYVLARLVPAAASWSGTAWVYMTRLINEKLRRKQNVNAQQEALERRRVLRPSQAVSSLKSSFFSSLPFKLNLIHPVFSSLTGRR